MANEHSHGFGSTDDDDFLIALDRSLDEVTKVLLALCNRYGGHL
jgi:hypothetical protein